MTEDHCDGSCSSVYPAPGTKILTPQECDAEFRQMLLDAAETPEKRHQLEAKFAQEDKEEKQRLSDLVKKLESEPQWPFKEAMPLEDYFQNINTLPLEDKKKYYSRMPLVRLDTLREAYRFKMNLPPIRLVWSGVNYM